MTTVCEQIASSLDAMRSCMEHHKEQPHLHEWIGKHNERARQVCDEHMPSGLGFDGGTQLIVGLCAPDKLVFQTSYHHMDEYGGYDGWTEHTVTVKPSLIHTFNIKISGRNRNDIKDYIHEAFDLALRISI